MLRAERVPKLWAERFGPSVAKRYAAAFVGGVCLLYTSDAADERSSVDLGGRRILKKKHKLGNTMEVA